MKNVILISKDCQLAEFYPPYNNRYYNTPNIDELACKGTVFKKHYTAAPSTAMSFTSMFTGKYSYQTYRKKYTEVDEYQGVTLFDDMYKKGYECHIIWDKSYVHLAQKFSKCYGKNSIFHNTDFLTHSQPKHIDGVFDDLTYKTDLENDCKMKFDGLLKNILNSKKPIFLWVHFPHVLSGRNAYGSDIDLFDEMIGICRRYFSDDNIFITADHGHMNGTHGKYGYGFDVYEEAIRIPLITPRLQGFNTVDFPTTNTQISDIILNRKVEKRPFVISETAYYEQPHRKMAIIKDNYKYIYNKMIKKEELYDLSWDENENVNLAYPEIYDVDRKRYFAISQRVYYTKWEESQKAFAELKDIKNKIWRNPNCFVDFYNKWLFKAKLFGAKVLKK